MKRKKYRIHLTHNAFIKLGLAWATAMRNERNTLPQAERFKFSNE